MNYGRSTQASLVQDGQVRYTPRLEVEPELHRQGPRRHVVRPAKGRQEVVQRIVVRQVDGRELKAPLVSVSHQEVVIAYRNIEEVA